jgi:hypothetical protein
VACHDLRAGGECGSRPTRHILSFDALRQPWTAHANFGASGLCLVGGQALYSLVPWRSAYGRRLASRLVALFRHRICNARPGAGMTSPRSRAERPRRGGQPGHLWRRSRTPACRSCVATVVRCRPHRSASSFMLEPASYSALSCCVCSVGPAASRTASCPQRSTAGPCVGRPRPPSWRRMALPTAIVLRRRGRRR